MMDNAERGVAVAVGIGNDADGQQIIDLVEAALLANDFPVQRVKALDARLKFRGDTVFHELGADGGLDVLEKSLVKRGLVAELLLQGKVGVGFQVTEGKILELAL